MADEDVVGKRLGNALGGVLVGQFNFTLDVDDLGRDMFRPFDGGLDGVDRLLRAVGTGGADEHLDPAGRVNAAGHLPGLLAQIALSAPDQDQRLQKASRLLTHRRSQPADGIRLRGDQKRWRARHAVFSRELMVQAVFLQGDAGAQLAKRPDQLPGRLSEHIVPAFFREEQQRDVVGQLLEGFLQLPQIGLARHLLLAVAWIHRVRHDAYSLFDQYWTDLRSHQT